MSSYKPMEDLESSFFNCRRSNYLWLRTLLLSAAALAMAGCSIAKTESFTFQAEVPENFIVDGKAYYVPAPGERCMDPSGGEMRGPGRLFFKSEQPKIAHLVEFKVPLTDTEHGCSTVLQRLELRIEGQWGLRDLDMSLASAGIVIDESAANSTTPPTSEPLVFQRECQWFFRTVGSRRFIRKLLECRALETNDDVKKRIEDGALRRDQLAGNTVKFVFTVARDELPAFDDNWVKFPAGWKRCMGKGLNDLHALCRGNTTDFKPFKMPDGRDCTVYPNCTE